MVIKVAVVLVMDDDPLARLLASEVVERAGFEAVEARDADQAIAILEVRADVRLVFTDVIMPGSMDGLQLARSIRDRWPPIQLMLTSGEAVDKASVPVGSRFVPKPYEEAQIADTLRSLLGSAA